MKKRLPLRSFALACAGLALTACALENPDRPAPTLGATPITVVEQREAEFVKLLPACPVSGPRVAPAAAQLAVAAAVAAAPVIIDFVVSGVRDYLQRVESEHTGSFMATGAGNLPENGSACLVVGRGMLGKPATALPSQGSLTEAQMMAVGLARPPAFYAEIKITTAVEVPPGKDAKPQTVIDFAPQLVQYAQTVAKRGKNEEKTVAAVFVMRTTAAPEKPTSATAAKDAEVVFPLNFGKLLPGTEVRPGDFAQVADHPLADLKRTTTVSGKLSSANFYVFVTESNDPSKVLVLLNKTLERQGDGLQKALTKAVEDAIKPDK